MSRFQAVPYEDRSDIDLNSMLDVVFIMLIFFIVTATFVREDGLRIDLPVAADIPPENVEVISVSVGPNSAFEINGRTLSTASVRPYVYALHSENPDADYMVILAADSVVKDAAVAIDAGRGIGLDVVPIIDIDIGNESLRN